MSGDNPLKLYGGQMEMVLIDNFLIKRSASEGQGQPLCANEPDNILHKTS